MQIWRGRKRMEVRVCLRSSGGSREQAQEGDSELVSTEDEREKLKLYRMREEGLALGRLR
jgi:hypothetical protein